MELAISLQEVMNTHKFTFLLPLIWIHTGTMQAQRSTEIVKKVLRATADFENYNIQFEKYFKFQSEKDTIKERYHSVVSQTDVDYSIGWHFIYSGNNATPKSLVATNLNEIARLNFKEHVYYNLKTADDRKKAINSLQLHIFHPFTRKQEDYSGFEVLKSDKSRILLLKLDTLRDASKNIKLINKTIISINRDTYIPESEESWTWFKKGGLQYSKYQLLEFEMFPKKRYVSILKSADSLINYIKSFTKGDSLKEKNRKFYKKIRQGDSAFVFNGTLFNGNKSFNLSQITDSIIILDFFYTTCAPCVTAVAEINKFYNRNLNRNVMILGVNPFSNDWPKLEKFVNEKGINYPIVLTEEELVLEYGVTGYPRLFIIKNGIIVKIFYGYTKDIENLLQSEVDALLKG